MTTALRTPHRIRRARHHHILVVVDDPCASAGLCAGVQRSADHAAVEALIIAPLRGAATQWYVDEDAARADATHRLRTCVSCLADGGIRASGRLADPDPVEAIADALHDFPADEILIVTAPRRPSSWLREDVIDRARRRFPQPVEHIVVAGQSRRGAAAPLGR